MAGGCAVPRFRPGRRTRREVQSLRSDAGLPHRVRRRSFKRMGVVADRLIIKPSLRVRFIATTRMLRRTLCFRAHSLLRPCTQ
jgi:hypothetical protein